MLHNDFSKQYWRKYLWFSKVLSISKPFSQSQMLSSPKYSDKSSRRILKQSSKHTFDFGKSILDSRGTLRSSMPAIAVSVFVSLCDLCRGSRILFILAQVQKDSYLYLPQAWSRGLEYCEIEIEIARIFEVESDWSSRYSPTKGSNS